MDANRFRIIPLKEGFFTIEYKTSMGWKRFTGTSNLSIKEYPLMARKSVCLYVMRILRLLPCENIYYPQSWRKTEPITDRIRRKFNLNIFLDY